VCSDFVPDTDFARVQLNKADLMLALPNHHLAFEKPFFKGFFYINTNQVDAWWSMLKDICQVAYPIETFEYSMGEFGIYDCNGYLLQFGQSMLS
jgi:hypothetical protein